MESLGTEARGGKGSERGKRSERRKRGKRGKEKRGRKGKREKKGRKEKREKKGRREGKGRRERKERKERKEKRGRKERRYWRRRKEGDIGDGRRKGASLLKSCTKRVKSSFLLRIMLKMLHFNANRNLFCNFVLRTAVITKFSFPKI